MFQAHQECSKTDGFLFSDDSDEIVECDSCGISVHEACYGIQVLSLKKETLYGKK